ncbi:beta strand repeat-containing protein, partial [Saccharicrinis sp. GN24d3]|uniref:beta strand repeat-containing protein n=1 Tax=Saccharicrinis sp. GN24d3 TaxID=3458416 RepID=UPI0040357CE5
MRRFLRRFLASLAIGMFLVPAMTQTPGLIFEPSSGTKSDGITLVLDPDGNGYVDQASDGIGFTDAVSITIPGNDVLEFEIPMLPFPTLGGGEALGDVRSGPDEGFTDFSINDNGTASYYYLDDENNFIFRFRLADYRPNAKGYTVLIDTDQKFGDGDDPNYNSTNPGFEIAIMLRSKHEVSLIDIDGVTGCGSVIQTYSLSSNHQKSISGIGPASDGTLDYFYDFYIPFADITSHFTTHDINGNPVTTSTLLRMTATTNTSNTCTFEGSLSDVGGVDDSQYGGCIECLWEELIEGEVPTDPSGNGGFPPMRTDCPTILGDYGEGTINIVGLSEPEAIVDIYLSTDLSASVASATASADRGDGLGDWTSTAFAAVSGETYVAVAQVAGKSESRVACTSVTIDAITCNGNSPALSVVVNANGEAEIIADWTSSFTLANAQNAVLDIFSNGISIVGTSQTNPAQGQFDAPTTSGTIDVDGLITWVFDMNKNGAKVPCGTLLVTLEDIDNGLCPNTATVCNTATGSCNSNVLDGTINITVTNIVGSNLDFTVDYAKTGSEDDPDEVVIYVNGIAILKDASTGTSWSFSNVDLSLYTCASLTATVNYTSGCTSLHSNAVTVSEESTAPVITDPGLCGTTSYIYGTALESDGTTPNVGATVYLFLNGSGAAESQITTVNTLGDWTITGLSLSAGTTVRATVVDDDECQSESGLSNEITIGTQSSNASSELSITTTNILPTTTTISGTCNGSATNVNVYIDDILLGAATTVSGGIWTLSPVPNTDDNYLYEGGKIQVTQSVGGNCESDLSTEFEIVNCISTPAVPNITYTQTCTDIANTSISDFSFDNITETNVLYRLVDKDGSELGYSFMSKASDIGNSKNFTTVASQMVNLTDEPPKTFTVEASYFNPGVDCLASTSESFYLNSQGEIEISSTTNPSSCEGADGTIVISGLENSLEYTYTFKKNGEDATGAPFTVTSSSTGTHTIPGLSYGEYTDIKFTYNGCTTVSPLSQTLSGGGSTSTAFPVQANPTSVESENAASIEIGDGSNVTNSAFLYSLYTSDGTFVASVNGNDAGGVSISTGSLTSETTFFVIVDEGGSCSRITTEPTVSISSCTNPTIAFDAMSHPSTCGGSDGSITIDGLDNSTTYSVNYSMDGSGQGPVDLVSDVSGSLTINNLTSGSYTNISVTISSCTSNVIAGAYVLSDPPTPEVPTASVTAQPTCTIATGTISVSSSVTDLNFSIDGTDYTNTTGTFTGLAAGNYSVIARNAAGCVSDASAILNVNTQPATPGAPGFTGNAAPNCSQSGVVYSITSPALGSFYSWTVPADANIVSGDGTASITVDFGRTNGDVTVSETNSEGCTGAASELVINLQGCELSANFSADKLSTCTGETVRYTNASEGTTGSTTYSWNFGANATPATATGVGPHDIVYSSEGMKTVSLEIIDGATVEEIKTDYVTINALPIPDFASEVTSVAAGTGNHVYTTASGMSNYSWIIPVEATVTAGGTSTDNSVTLTWNTAGNHSLSVNYEENGCSGASPAVSNVTVIPTVSINDASVTEGSGNLSFEVTLNASSEQTVTVNYETSDNTATLLNNDYTQVNVATLTFIPGETTKTVVIVVTEDEVVEGSESMYINLLSPTNATILDNQGEGTINDNDSATLSITANDATADESGSNDGQYTVTLSAVSSTDTEVTYTLSGTAIEGSDYAALAGTVTIPAGSTSVTIDVEVSDDVIVETDETVIATLSSVTGNSEISIDTDNEGATITISDNDINDVPVANNDALSADEDNPGTVNVTTNDTDGDGTITVSTVDLDPSTAGVQNTFASANGSWSADALGVVTFTPDADWNGVEAISYVVSDNDGSVSNTATITATIDAVNDAPAANDDVASVDEDGVLSGPSLLANDIDPEGDGLTINTTPVSD